MIEKKLSRLNKRKIKNSKKGFGLIEIILVVGVGMMTFLGIEQYLEISLKAVVQDSHQVEALYRAKANLEAARAVRDENWTLLSGLTAGSQYSFLPGGANPQKWVTQAGTMTEGAYTLWMTTSSVQRDVNGNIVSVGGTVDANTLKINSNVSWPANGVTKQVTVSEYLVNYK